MKFRHLDIPRQWTETFTKYPHGLTIFEALVDWTSQVDKMVDNVNDWNEYLDGFVDNFEFELQDEVAQTLERWESEGKLEEIIVLALGDEVDRLDMELDSVRQGQSDLSGEVEFIKENFVSVREYGAVGDGVTDDSQAFQTAISENKNVYIPPGEYVVENITVGSDRNIKGMGNPTIILKEDEEGFILDNVVRTTVSGLYVKMEEEAEGATFINIKNSSTRIKVSDIYCSYVDYPVKVDYSWIISIDRLIVQGCKIGIEAKPQANALSITNSVINNASEKGVAIGNSEGITIINSAFHNCYIAVEGGNYTRALNITGCYFEDNSYRNINLNANTIEIRGVVIQGNHFKQIRGGESSKLKTDIFIRFSNGVVISGNEFTMESDRINDYQILMYDVNPGPNKNVVIFANYFHPDLTPIASTTNYENQSTFPTDFHTQPFGLS